MAIDLTKNQLIELYKIAREEAYHHDTINMQLFMALGVVISLLLVAISFIFSSDSLLREGISVHFVKVGILVLFIFVLMFFLSAFYRIDRAFRACDKVGKEIKYRLLSDKRTKEIFKFDALLVVSELEKIDSGKCYARLSKWYENNRLKVYIKVSLAASIVLGLFLFLCIS